ncbi:LLM class F420-dependent oxidoreductase [Arsenicicoccus sp. oral taxon 190]|uniref:LLM class F420-dependent oxidoreductase n=1 Tax=Arsenicicoccus sp. oral taxon 190 TaxID=1658671 RepID=UPI00067A2E6C|nr:LLM class F420-dependent oxidoreductase [Arsenicicoccus sp. oral taxon 190]AKT50488.1 5,10-methylene tetrahydromethanopterin reductase [Arsenicicoccus sp. oral taxon 190]
MTSTPASRPVRIGVQLQPQHATYPQLRDAVRRAEDLGVDIVYTWDHFYPLYGDPDGAHFECWTTLAAWAEQTSRVQIAALVTCNSYRNPDLLADMARTVDHISDGRLILGIGSGWFERDYVEYGYDFGTAGSRLDDLAAAMPRIKARWERLNPPPTRPIPVLVGGGGERKTLRIVAEHADVWHTFTGGEELAHKLEVLRRHCSDVGRDPAEIEVSVGVGGRGREGRQPEAPEVEGGPLLELGATTFTMGTGGPDHDLAMVEPWLRWRDEVNAGRSS